MKKESELSDEVAHKVRCLDMTLETKKAVLSYTGQECQYQTDHVSADQ